MKHLFSYITLTIAVLSCSPEEYSTPAPLTEKDLDWGYYATQTPNEYILYNNTDKVTSLWDLGNGVTAKGDSVVARYTFAGHYTVKLTVISQGGTLTAENHISISEDNPSFLSGYPYDELTGSSEKVWAVDAYCKGHFGLGPTIANPTEWYGAGVYEKADRDFYDDRFTFSMTETGLTVNQNTNGKVYANGAWAADLGTTAGNEESDGSDFIMPFDGGAFSCSYLDGKITVNNGGFLGYYAGAKEYQIITLTDEVLEVVFYDTKGSFYWFTRFAPIDQLTPKPLPIVKELKTKDIKDDFDGNGNIIWNIEQIEKFETINNFVQVPANETKNIAMYQKGSNEWSNVKTVLDFYINLSERSMFSLKVFIPGFNNYSAECNPGTDWLPEHLLKPQIDIKLQNSALEDDAWQTQELRSHSLTNEQMNRWIELTFDFSDVDNRTDFDQIIIQLGAEGHCNPGLFYIDDFKLL